LRFFFVTDPWRVPDDTVEMSPPAWRRLIRPN
jgi:hypothetical protein